MLAAIQSVLGKETRPIVTTLHLGDISEIGGIGGFAGRVYEQTVGRLLLRRSDRVIVVSERVGRKAEQLGVPPNRIHIVPNGVDVSTFAPGQSAPMDPKILFVGRLVRNKGPDTLLDAVPAIRERHPNVTVEFVGTGPLESKLRQRAKELRLQDTVVFSGYVDSVADRLKEATVFCRPSLSEGLPLTLLEAMASGVPPVVTPIAGVEDVVSDGDTGCLVPVRDPDTLANCISGLLADEKRRTRIGENARAYVTENHSWEQRANNIARIYYTVV